MDWLTDTVVIAIIGPVTVAIIGLIGALLGQVVSKISQRETARLSVLEATVTALQERVRSLESSLRDSESAYRQTVDALREAERLGWHALEYGRAWRSWYQDAVDDLPGGLVLPEPPSPPDPIADRL